MRNTLHLDEERQGVWKYSLKFTSSFNFPICMSYCHYILIPLCGVSFMRGIITTYTCACLFHPHPWEGNTNACTHKYILFLCQEAAKLYPQFMLNLMLYYATHTHTQLVRSNMYVYEYICKSYQSYTYATHYQKWNTNENVRQETNTATKITVKISNFLVSKCVLPLGVSLHMFCTQILLCTQHQHAYRRRNTQVHAKA